MRLKVTTTTKSATQSLLDLGKTMLSNWILWTRVAFIAKTVSKRNDECLELLNFKSFTY